MSEGNMDDTTSKDKKKARYYDEYIITPGTMDNRLVINTFLLQLIPCVASTSIQGVTPYQPTAW